MINECLEKLAKNVKNPEQINLQQHIKIFCESLEKTQKWIWGLKGLCEESFENLGKLICKIQGKYGY